MSDDVNTTTEEAPTPVLTEVQERGRKRLAVATNAAAWAIYGNDDEVEVTIDPKDVAMSEVVAIRVLTQLREAGLLDNEPLLGLATTRELIEELKARSEVGLGGTGPSCDEERKIGAICDVMLCEAPDDVLNYSTAKKKPVAGESTNDNTGDAAEKENTE